MTVHGNGISLTNHTNSYIKNYGDMWFHERAITNIILMKGVQSNFRVTYLSAYGRMVIVHMPNGVNMHFSMRADGLKYHYTNNRKLKLF